MVFIGPDGIKTFSQIRDESKGALVAIFSGFGEELHNDVGEDGGDVCGNRVVRCCFNLMWGYRHLGDVAVDHSHGVFGLKRALAGEHFVEGGAQGIKIGAVIHGSVHAPGLFRGHVGESSFQNIGIQDGRRFPGQFSGDAKINDFDFIRNGIPHDIGRIDILVHDVLLMNLTQDFGHADGELKEMRQGQACVKDKPVPFREGHFIPFRL